MENLIMKSFLDYPEHIEDFLEDISIKSFTPFNQKLIKILVGMNHRNQAPRLETIKLRIGEKEFESEEFKRILVADSYPDYLNLKPPKQKSQISLVFGMNALVPLGTI